MEQVDVLNQLTKLKGQLEEEQATHDALLKELQSKFEASDKALKALKEKSEPVIKLLRNALPASELHKAKPVPSDIIEEAKKALEKEEV